MENKRFPQQRFSPVNPARARSLTPERSRYFSPIPISRPMTPDFNGRHSKFVQSSTGTFPKCRTNDMISPMQQRKYTTGFCGTKEKPVLPFHSGQKSAFISVESKKANSIVEDNKTNLAVEKKKECKHPSLDENGAGSTTSTASYCGNLSTFSLPSLTTSNTLSTRPSDATVSDQSKLRQDKPSLPTMSDSDKTALMNVPYGSFPQLVYSSCGNVARHGSSFSGQGLAYQQVPSSYVSPMVALAYPGLRNGPPLLQDKLVSHIRPHTLPAQIPTGPAALLRPSSNVLGHGGHPLVNAVFSPVVNIHVQPQDSGLHTLPPDVAFLKQDEKDQIKHHKSKDAKDANTIKKHEGLQKQPLQITATLLGSAAQAPQDTTGSSEKEGRSTKNILKKYVADGMEQ